MFSQVFIYFFFQGHFCGTSEKTFSLRSTQEKEIPLAPTQKVFLFSRSTHNYFFHVWNQWKNFFNEEWLFFFYIRFLTAFLFHTENIHFLLKKKNISLGSTQEFTNFNQLHTRTNIYFSLSSCIFFYLFIFFYFFQNSKVFMRKTNIYVGNQITSVFLFSFSQICTKSFWKLGSTQEKKPNFTQLDEVSFVSQFFSLSFTFFPPPKICIIYIYIFNIMGNFFFQPFSREKKHFSQEKKNHKENIIKYFPRGKKLIIARYQEKCKIHSVSPIKKNF